MFYCNDDGRYLQANFNEYCIFRFSYKIKLVIITKKQYFRQQLIAITLAVVTFIILVGLLWLEVLIINIFSSEKIAINIRATDVIIGMTIYFKTSIDFVIFIGRLMAKNPGLKGRIGIEIGTALGNAVGTLAILLLWAIFKEINWLLAIMIIVASLVLIRLAQDGIVHTDDSDEFLPSWFVGLTKRFEKILQIVNYPINPLLSNLLPDNTLKVTKKATFIGLLTLSFTVPFVLGLDDFAGYVPLFNIVNVFGFSIGIFAGHMILNIFLCVSPKHTTEVVKNPVLSLIGSMAFVVLAIWGFIEAYKLLFYH